MGELLVKDEYQVVEFMRLTGNEVGPVRSGHFPVRTAGSDGDDPAITRKSAVDYAEYCNNFAGGICSYRVRRVRTYDVDGVADVPETPVPETPRPSTASMTAVTEQRKTGYFVTHASGNWYTDDAGHIWFSRELAAQLARELGGWYESGQRGTIKTVVTRYKEM